MDIPCWHGETYWKVAVIELQLFPSRFSAVVSMSVVSMSVNESLKSISQLIKVVGTPIGGCRNVRRTHDTEFGVPSQCSFSLLLFYSPLSFMVDEASSVLLFSLFLIFLSPAPAVFLFVALLAKALFTFQRKNILARFHSNTKKTYFLYNARR